MPTYQHGFTGERREVTPEESDWYEKNPPWYRADPPVQPTPHPPTKAKKQKKD